MINFIIYNIVVYGVYSFIDFFCTPKYFASLRSLFISGKVLIV